MAPIETLLCVLPSAGASRKKIRLTSCGGCTRRPLKGGITGWGGQGLPQGSPHPRTLPRPGMFFSGQKKSEDGPVQVGALASGLAAEHGARASPPRSRPCWALAAEQGRLVLPPSWPTPRGKGGSHLRRAREGSRRRPSAGGQAGGARAVSSCGELGLLSSCPTQNSHCQWFLLLWSPSSRAGELSSCGARA